MNVNTNTDYDYHNGLYIKNIQTYGSYRAYKRGFDDIDTNTNSINYIGLKFDHLYHNMVEYEDGNRFELKDRFDFDMTHKELADHLKNNSRYTTKTPYPYQISAAGQPYYDDDKYKTIVGYLGVCAVPRAKVTTKKQRLPAPKINRLYNALKRRQKFHDDTDARYESLFDPNDVPDVSEIEIK